MTTTSELSDITVGSKVNFPRGMFGMWTGKVCSIYRSQGTFAVQAGTMMAAVKYRRKNGSTGTQRLPVAALRRTA